MFAYEFEKALMFYPIYHQYNLHFNFRLMKMEVISFSNNWN